MICRFLLTAALVLLPVVSAAQPPKYEIEVAVNVPASEITGTVEIYAAAGESLNLSTGTLTIESVTSDGRDVPVSTQSGRISIIPQQDGMIRVRFTGFFPAAPVSGDPMSLPGNEISDRGISLTGTWYPVPDGLHQTAVRVTLPRGYEAVAESEKTIKVMRDDAIEFHFSFDHPVAGVNLVASDRYGVMKDSYKKIDIYAYFFREDQSLAGQYIEYTKQYLRMYEDLLGNYPYRRFSIVENFLPTGYSMPTYTLLGGSVVRLPFIVETSLGHEILHQWFGNSVYIDYGSGNWAEGLTSYLSDHLYEERKGAGWNYRKQILADYRSYVTPENDFPLRQFTGRVDFPSKSIGYGKTAMVFHMLRNLVSDNVFFSSLKDVISRHRFTPASWDDLKESFENRSGRDLSWFFTQWLMNPGLPVLEIGEFEISRTGGQVLLEFTVVQKDRIYEFTMPAAIYLDGEIITKNIHITNARERFEFVLPQRPEKIVFDANYDTARLITDGEYPPVVAGLIGDRDLIIVLPPENEVIYDPVIRTFKDRDPHIMEAGDVSESDLAAHAVLICDDQNPLVHRLFGSLPHEHAGFSVLVRKNPWNASKVAAVVYAESADEVDRAIGKIFHYGKYSVLSFKNGKLLGKETAMADRGIVVQLNDEATAVDISQIKTLREVIRAVSSRKIVYVGEVHDVFAHHAVQLDIIAGIYKTGQKLAIGMEMFQRPFQEVLDSFIAGRMGERAFLKASEYFQRWGFDYNLYKPILDFAREEKVPVIALNIRREIIDKVSHSGIESLEDNEKALIPADMDFSDASYRKRLEEIFSMHRKSESGNFDFFYQSQILWDETMSGSVDSFLQKNPDYSLVVLAGQGHLMYGSGIPKRTYRRNGYDYSIVLIDANVEKDIADFVVFPAPVKGITAPKLMIFLRQDGDGRLTVTGFPEDSVSEKAGMKTGDIMVSVDDFEIKSIEDVRIHLLYKKRDERVRVRVLRKEMGKDAEIEIEVTL